MLGIKVIKEHVFGDDCLGAIYIDLIHEASGEILNADVLHDFTMALYGAIYKTGQWNSIIVCYNEHSFFVNDLNADLISKDLKWFKIYCDENNCYFCDQIEIIKDKWKEKTVIMHGSSTCDDWYSVILKEMCTVCRYGERTLFRFAIKLREQFASVKWNNDGEEHTLYITANEVNIQYQEDEFWENIGRYDCSSDIYDETERYYKLTMVPNGDAKFVEYVKEV